MTKRRFATALLLAVVLVAPARAQDADTVSAPQPLVIGETFTIRSAILGETRRINVYAPPGYADSASLRLPVLYMPDGGIGEDFLHVAGLVQISVLNGTMRPFLLVGIENTQRRRDLTGPTEVEEDRRIAPRVGGAQAFRDFIRRELMPRVRARYRTTDETAIVGESLAGLFVVETYLLEPDLFDTYIALDPSLWWNGEHLLRTVRGRLGPAHRRKTLYFAGSADMGPLTERFARELDEGGGRTLSWRHVAMPDEKHATLFHPGALAAFRALFAPPPAR